MSELLQKMAEAGIAPAEPLRTQNRPKMIPLKASNWLQDTVSMAIEQGHRPIPILGETPARFGAGERYEIDHPAWTNSKINPERVAIALGDFVLLDYDGHKVDDPISPGELFAILGGEPMEVQRNEKGDSLHFFYRIPEGVSPEELKHSNDGWLNGVDIKTKSQLVYLKRSKILVDEELPRLCEVPPAPPVLIDALRIRKKSNTAQSAFASSKAGKHKATEILSHVDPDCDYSTWLTVGMGLHQEFAGDDLGLAIWDDWSARGDKYRGFSLLKYKWDSFSTNLDGVTFATICHHAQKSGADLQEINSRFDDQGNPHLTFDEMLSLANSMTPETPDDEIQRVIIGTARLSAIQRRKVFDALKRQTKIPLSALKEALKESASGGGETDQLQLARMVIEHLGDENIITTGPLTYEWDTCGVWRRREERALKQYVHDTIPSVVEEVTKSLVDGVADLIKTEVFKPDHLFNVGEPECVNTENGQLYLSDSTWRWTLKPHQKEDYRTTQIPVKFDPVAKAPKFEKFMNSVFAGDHDGDLKIQAILEMIGYSLLSHCKHEKFVILVGSGANGKSVLLSVLESICGPHNVAGVQPSQFDNRFQRAHLAGKLVNVISEVAQGEQIADAALKGIVSGEASTVEEKHRDPFVMHPFATVWLGTNHLPHTRDFSDGLFRRALVVEFNNKFTPARGNCNPNLKRELFEELPGILNFALKAYASAMQHGFTHPPSCEQARNEWRLEADQVAQFVDECCMKSSGCEVSIREAFQRYEHWASASGINRKLAKKGFRERLTRLGFGERRTANTRFVSGMKLKAFFEDAA